MIKKYVLIISLSLITLLSCFADIIYLNDGTELNGNIVYMDEVSLKVSFSDGSIRIIDRAKVGFIRPANGTTVENIPTTPVVPTAIPAPVTVGSTYLDTSSSIVDVEFESRKRILMYRNGEKTPVFASGLGFVFPGVGHFYCEEWLKGVFFMSTRIGTAALACWGLSQVQDPAYDDLEKLKFNNLVWGGIGAGSFAILTLIEVIDAYNSATNYNDILRMQLGIDTLDSNVIVDTSR